jgi:chorismate dehydratase
MTAMMLETGPAAGHASGESPVRVGRIEFVNCFPLYDHFADELAGRGVAATIIEGYPALLNRLLVDGEIDVTLPSSIEFARHAEVLRLVPEVSISSLGAVDSVQLFSRVPLAEVRTIALTEKSATSTCLLRVLCHDWGVQPEFSPRRGSFAEVLRDNDGLLLIGDEALHVLRSGFCPYHYDLGEEWRKVTGLPMVFAVCAARDDFVAARPRSAAAVGAALIASRDRCAAQPQQTAADAALRYDFSQAYLMEYFEKLKFGFAPEYRAGLQEFYRRAAAIGELERVPDVAVTGETFA